MAIHLIIDGYNLIRQSPNLRRYEEEDLDKGRKMLLKKLLDYQRIKRHEITLVFDGWMEGHFSESQGRVGGIKTVFSRRGEKADEVIKRLVSRKKGEAIVVTSDRDLGYSCSKQGCVIVSSPEFLAKMEFVECMDRKGKMGENENDYTPRFAGTKKKGPSKRLPKSQRYHRTVLKKL